MNTYLKLTPELESHIQKICSGAGWQFTVWQHGEPVQINKPSQLDVEIKKLLVEYGRTVIGRCVQAARNFEGLSSDDHTVANLIAMTLEDLQP